MKAFATFKLFMVLALCLIITGCIPNQMPTDNQNIPEFLTATGTITAKVQNGTDGGVWLMETTEGTIYEVLLSIPNLGEIYSQYLRDVDIGTTVQVSGKTLKLNFDKYIRIIAKTLELK